MHPAMESLVRLLPVICCCVLLCEAAPWRNYEVRQSQVCGDKLADMLSLVCSGRGYNFAFKPEGSGARRFRRGIVEECCRKSCSPAFLELYCRADPTEVPTNVQIRKRSDSGMESIEHQLGDVTKHSTSEPEVPNTSSQENKIEQKESTSSTIMKEGDNSNKLIELLSPSEHSTRGHESNNLISKTTPNDTTEDDFYKQSNLPLLRHHKNHLHHNRRQLRNHKASTKIKRDKVVHGESTQTFQIGTRKPYFAGRALASYRTYVHHTPLS